jgi:hypothetical protein
MTYWLTVSRNVTLTEINSFSSSITPPHFLLTLSFPSLGIPYFLLLLLILLVLMQFFEYSFSSLLSPDCNLTAILFPLPLCLLLLTCPTGTSVTTICRRQNQASLTAALDKRLWVCFHNDITSKFPGSYGPVYNICNFIKKTNYELLSEIFTVVFFRCKTA